MGINELDILLKNFTISQGVKPLEDQLINIEKAENRLVEIRSFNDLSRTEVNQFAKKDYEGKKAELKKPLVESNSLDVTIVKFNFAVNEDISAYFEAYTKFDELIYATLNKLKNGKIFLSAEKEKIISGKNNSDYEKMKNENKVLETGSAEIEVIEKTSDKESPSEDKIPSQEGQYSEKKENLNHNNTKTDTINIENNINRGDFNPFEYDNLETAPDEFLDKIVFGDQKKLKKSSGGKMIELCEKYAQKYRLEKGKTLPKKYEVIIAAEIIRCEKYTTTPGSVGSTLRGEKLLYKKIRNKY